jgi:Dicarboxylate transport
VTKKRLLFLSLLAIILLGAYSARITLVKSAVNVLSFNTGFTLTQIDGLSWQDKQLFVNQITFVLDNNTTEQTLDGLRWEFSDLSIKHSHLSIQSGFITLPTPSSSQGRTPFTLNSVLKNINEFPIGTVEIHELKAAPLPDLISIRWTSTISTRAVLIEDAFTSVEIKLDQSQPTHVKAHMQIYQTAAKQSQTLLQLEANLGTNSHQLQLAGELRTEKLLESLRHYFQLPNAQLTNVQLPNELVSLEGNISFVATGVVNEQLNRINLSYRFDDDAKLFMTLKPTSETQQPVKVELHLNGGVNFAVENLSEASLESLSFSIEDEQFGLGATGSFKSVRCSWQDKITLVNCSGELSASANVEHIQWQQWQLENTQLRLATTFTFDKRLVGFTIKPESMFRSDKIQFGKSSLNHILMTPEGLFTTQLKLPLDLFTLRLDKLHVMIPEFQYQNTTIATRMTLSDIHFNNIHFDNIQLDNPQFDNTQFDDNKTQVGRLNLQADSINIKTNDLWMPALSLQSTFTLKNRQLTGTGQLLSDRQYPLIDYSLTHDIDQSYSSVKASSSQIRFNRDKPLSSYFSNWPYDWDVQQGQYGLQTTLSWRENVLSGDIKQQLLNISGQYSNSAFIGINASVHTQLLNGMHILTTQPVDISIASVDVGITINNITAKFSADSRARRIDLKAFKAELLDGLVMAGETPFILGQNNTLQVDVHELSLDRALSLTGYDIIQGSGLINGQIPIAISPENITVKLGQLSAVPPGGVIVYTPVSDTDNASVKLVNDALSNYHYDSLGAEVAYDKNGNLDLAIALRGQNPDFQQGQRINLNLNVTDNIPMLLRSLQAGRTVTDVVERKLDSSQ